MLHGTVSNVAWFVGTLLVMGYVSARDFAESRRARIELAELKSHLAQIERVSMLGQLSSALAHELTQPLTAIKLNVGAALRHIGGDGPDIKEIQEALTDIRSDDERAIAIIERLRELFKARAIDLRPCDLADIARDVQLLLDGEARTKRIDILWAVPADLPTALCDRVHISQVLLNLIINSIQAINDGSVAERMIEIEARSERGKLEVIIRDSGPGISGAVADQIFSPLVTTKPEGLGMGLALSRTIIEAHGGHLWAENGNQSKGAAFHFTLRPAGAKTAILAHGQAAK